jgi:hypothetical protein
MIRTDVSRCSGYEFEDVLADLESAEILLPTLPSLDHWQHRMRRFLSQRTQWFERVPSGASRAALPADCDIFFACVQKPVELLTLDACPGWREKSGLAVCVLEEVWQGTITQYRPLLKTLSRFDLIACAFADSCKPLAELTGRPVIHLPGAADMLRFLPTAPRAEQPVDIYYIGRRRPELHDALLAAAREENWFYLYDSFAKPPIVSDHRQHRDLFASLVQKSKMFVVDYAKIGHQEQRGGQLLWGPRHVEGMAGGAVQIGFAPDSPDYAENFDWPESVLRLPEDPEKAVAEVRRLLADKTRRSALRALNFERAAIRHDWLDRWRRILHALELDEPAAMAEREDQIRRTCDRLTACGSRDGPGAERPAAASHSRS